MDFLKLMVFSTLIWYGSYTILPCLSFTGLPSLPSLGTPRWSILPHSTRMVPLGSVTTEELCICIKFGFSQKRVLPEPLPAVTSTFLLRAYLGFLGRLGRVWRSGGLRLQC